MTQTGSMGLISAASPAAPQAVHRMMGIPAPLHKPTPAIILDPAQLKVATISFTIGFMWKLSDGEMLTRPPASSIARATTGPTAAIVVRAKPCRSVSSH